jgi:hypothetical protein
MRLRPMASVLSERTSVDPTGDCFQVRVLCAKFVEPIFVASLEITRVEGRQILPFWPHDADSATSSATFPPEGRRLQQNWSQTTSIAAKLMLFVTTWLFGERVSQADFSADPFLGMAVSVRLECSRIER